MLRFLYLSRQKKHSFHYLKTVLISLRANFPRVKNLNVNTRPAIGRLSVAGQDLSGDPGPAGEGRGADAVQQVVEGHGRRLQPGREEEGLQGQPARHR